jgi:hypothetical protein
MGTSEKASKHIEDIDVKLDGDRDQRLRAIFSPGDHFMVRCKVGGLEIDLNARMKKDLQSSPSTLEGKWGVWMNPAVLKPAADNIRDGKVKDAENRLAGCAEVIRLWREKGEPDTFWIGHQGVASHLVKAANKQSLSEEVFDVFAFKIDGEFVYLKNNKSEKPPKDKFLFYDAGGRIGIEIPGHAFLQQGKQAHFASLRRAYELLANDISYVSLILDRKLPVAYLAEMIDYTRSLPEDFAEHKRRATCVSSPSGAKGAETSAVLFECDGWSRDQYLTALANLNSKEVVDPPLSIRKSLFDQSSNIVLEGVPGTGKTHAITGLEGILETVSKRPVTLTATGVRFMTMHPSTSYEDFVEGLRPAGSTQRSFVVWGEADNAGKAQPIAPLSTAQNRPKEQWVTFETDNQLITVNAALENSGWFVQLQPTATAGFTVRDGFFVEACKHAVANPTTAVVVVLDELNRCNIPKVLGDLMTVIEESKRAHWDETKKAWVVDSPTKAVTLPYSGRKLFVPDNLFIVGTMNTTDRSVAPMDAALRRRFAFHRIWPQGFGPDAATTGPELRARLGDAISMTASFELWKAINTLLLAKYGADAMLGHSYLDDLSRALSRKDANAAEVVAYHWNYRILPQLMDVIASNGLTRSLVEDPKAFFGNDARILAGIEIAVAGSGSLRTAELRYRAS